MSIIYRATSKTTGKSYIGQTVLPFKQRKAAHINEAKRTTYNLSCKFHKAIIDLGESDFEWFIEKDLSVYDIPPEKIKKLLTVYERELILQYDSKNNGYNENSGGSGYMKNFNLTKEEKLAIRREKYQYRKENDPDYVSMRKKRRQMRMSNTQYRINKNIKIKNWRDSHREEFREQRKQYKREKEIEQ